jgi:16S rRNA processing protein RimM
VLADLFTDFPERFNEHPRVWLAAPGVTNGAANATADVQPAEIAAHWLPVGRNAGRIVLQLAGVDTIEKAEQLAGKEVLVPLTERLPLEAGAAYISDLTGCTVYDHDRPLGVVDSVQFPTTPDGSHRLEDAAPLLVILSTDGDEILIPFAKAFLLNLDVAGKSIRMELPAGLTEINRSSDASAGHE